MGKYYLQNNEVRAVSKYVRISPSKVNRVLKQIKGKSCKDALTLLEFMPYSACEPIIKALRSAIANSKNNLNLNEGEIFVKSAFVDKGPVLKRFRPRAQGRAYRILKATSHITIVVAS